MPSPQSSRPDGKVQGLHPASLVATAVLLEAAAGDDGLIAKLIDAFGRETDARIERMRGALAASNFPSIRAEAHTIKGKRREYGS